MPKGRINPYNPGNPVKSAHFAGRRSQLEAIQEGLAISREGYSQSFFLKGEWGMGKTSILQKLRPALEEHGVLIQEDVQEGNANAQINAFLPALFQGLLDSLSPREEINVKNPFADDPLQGVNYEQPYTYRPRLVELIGKIWRERNLITIVTLDNLERAKFEFLVQLKDLFQRVGNEAPHYLLVFAGRSLPGAGENAADPIARFFRTISVDPMSDAEAIDAIAKPVLGIQGFRFHEDAFHWIQRRAAGHPYFLKQICYDVFDIANGAGEIDGSWLEGNWKDIALRLEQIRFGNELAELPDAETKTLLRASMHGPEFTRSAISGDKPSTTDTALRRLVNDRGLLKPISRGAYRFYHPLFHAYVAAKAEARGLEKPVNTAQDLRELIREGEGQYLEFKESLLFDVATGEHNKSLVAVVLKTIAAFCNAGPHGDGVLLIGVSDDGTIMGVDRDMQLLSKQKNKDEYMRFLKTKIRDCIEPKGACKAMASFQNVDSKDICVVRVPRSRNAVYINGELYARDGSESLKIEKGVPVEDFLKRRDSS